VVSRRRRRVLPLARSGGVDPEHFRKHDNFEPGVNLAIPARDPSVGGCPEKRMESEMGFMSLMSFQEVKGEGDTFDFKPELTSEPTAQAGRPIGDCESKVWVQTRLLTGETDIGGFVIDGSADPFPTATIGPAESLLDL
jgi:hypothetical protein